MGTDTSAVGLAQPDRTLISTYVLVRRSVYVVELLVTALLTR
jgi:hypothetical protein